MSKSKALAVTLALLVCAACGSDSTGPTAEATPTATLPPASTPEPPSAVVVLTAQNFSSQVLASDGTWMVEFYRPDCPHCQSMITIVETLATDYRGRASVGKVNTNAEPALIAPHQIQVVPTFLFFRHGREVSRHEGTAAYSTLAGMLDAALASP